MLKPFRTHLTVLQQEGYSISRFLSWWLSHPLTYSLSSKKGLVKTSKTGLITKLSLLYLALINFSLFYSGQLLLLLILDMVLLLAPFPLLFLSLLSLIPYEKINRYLTVERVRSAITSHSKLDVIGITGSYGKTSVKDFLCTILQPYAPTVKTPESYNTVFGIAKVV
ncbi:MAG: UDP-N-acetylmuramoyl-tripeptide-D-alanyl-D-alanine ligase, partial [Candidatus Collierbacteria bacterium GW2011_GWA1_44_12]